jgi:hypothetical protein
MRAIIDSDPRRHVVPLVLLSGLAGGLGPDHPAWGILGTIALAVAGLPVVWMLGFVLARAGRLLGGTGDAVAVRAAIAWAGVPGILGTLVWLTVVAAFGRATLADEFAGRVAVRFSRLADVWVMVLGLVTLAEAHRFSVVRAFGTTVLGTLVLVVPLVIAVLIVVSTGLYDPNELLN